MTVFGTMTLHTFAPLLPKLPIPCALIGDDQRIKLMSDQGILLGYELGQMIEESWVQDFLSSGRIADRFEIEQNDCHWQIDISRTEDGAVFVATDISDLVAISQAKDELTRKMLKHDAKTHSVGAKFFLWRSLDMAIKAVTPDTALISFIQKATGAIDRLEQLIESSAYLYGAGKTPRRSIVVKILVKQAINSLAPQIHDSGAKVSIEGNGTRVWGDPVRLLQALINLISNSIKYQSKRSGHQPLITVSITEESFTGKRGQILVEVSDNGIGIPLHHHHKIFSPFQRLHSSEDYPGSGLGLAIVHQVVREHRGTAGLESRLSGGVTFWIRLPNYADIVSGG